jgi:hypothetical protein
MTVRAHHLALFDLREDAFPASPGELATDRECFVADVIKLEDYRVALSAVNAGICLEVLDQVSRPLTPQTTFDLRGLIDVSLSIRLIVLSAIGRSTGAAERVTLSLAPPAPSEILDGFQLATSVALANLRSLSPHRTDVRISFGRNLA